MGHMHILFSEAPQNDTNMYWFIKIEQGRKLDSAGLE